jgi:glycosyltransferase involved in cell wall biosynthesis
MTKSVSHGRGSSSSNKLGIVISPPEFQPLQKEMSGEPTSATYVIQRYIAEGLLARGHRLTFIAPQNVEVIVCTTDPQNTQIAPQTWSDSQWFNFASKSTWTLQRWLGIPYLNMFSNYRLLDACLQCLPGNDIVYERHGLYKVGVAMASKRLKLPYVLYFEADDILEHDVMGKPINGLLRWRAREMMGYNLNAADCIIVVSKPLKTYLTTNWSMPAEKIVVFQNVADVQRFRPDLKSRTEVRIKFGLKSNPLVIFVGNFYEWHDVATLLDSFVSLLTTYPDSRLILVGDGTTREAMEKRASDLKLGNAVMFTGIVPHTEVPPLLAAADIAVVPYPRMRHDLWLSPLKLYEYMAAGTAVIASAVGQLNEVIQDGRNGLLVPPGDVSAMTAALTRLIVDPGLRFQLSQQARQDAIEKHSWEQYISRLEILFSAIITNQPFHEI